MLQLYLHCSHSVFDALKTNSLVLADTTTCEMAQYNLDLVERDNALLYYNDAVFRDLRVRRVLVLDVMARVALLTTPQRMLSTWREREAGEESPYLSLSGPQMPISPEALERYKVLLAGARGTAQFDAGELEFQALQLERDDQGRVCADDTARQCIRIAPSASVSWCKMFAQNMGNAASETVYIADSLGYARATNTQDFLLLIKECELDVALGSCTYINVDNHADGELVQFRNGYGAKWCGDGVPVKFENPLYSPHHKTPQQIDVDRVWVIAG